VVGSVIEISKLNYESTNKFISRNSESSEEEEINDEGPNEMVH